MMQTVLRHIRPERLRELILVLIIIAVAAFFATQIPDFLSARTFTRISTSVAVVAVVAKAELAVGVLLVRAVVPVVDLVVLAEQVAVNVGAHHKVAAVDLVEEGDSNVPIY